MLKQIGSTPIRRDHRGSCHCGAVILEIHLPDGLPTPHRCDCSFCKRRGAIVAAVPAADLKVIRGKSALLKYSFGQQVAEHFSAVTAASTPITGAAPISRSSASMLAALKGSILMIWARCRWRMVGFGSRLSWRAHQGSPAVQ